jgi:Cu2+-containing amine oxidase
MNAQMEANLKVPSIELERGGIAPWRALLRRAPAVLVALLVLVSLAAARPAPAHASAADYCSGEYLAIGANWSVCWEIRANEGLAISHAFYTKEGFDQRVLSDGTVAQIFVPYEVGEPRYHDVAYGLGPATQPLSADVDCPYGELLAGGRVCKELVDRGLAERFCAGACAARRGRALRLWSSSQMGAYNYITVWTFKDDGTIEPQMGLTGALQFGDTAHVHNIYWRLDVDLVDSAGDSVEEFWRINPTSGGGLTGAYGWNPLLGETYRPNDLYTFRKWRVADRNRENSQGAVRSYELIPHMGDGNFRSTAEEGFTRGEFWVTAQKPGERFVSTEDSDLLSSYIDGDPINGEDIVIWYAIHEHHEVRDEDAPYMPAEWMHFSLRPRDFFDANPLD